MIHTKKERGKWVYQIRPEAQEMSAEDLYKLYMKTSDYSLQDAAEDYPDLKALLNGNGDQKAAEITSKVEKKPDEQELKTESPIPSRIQIDVNFSPIKVIFRIRK